MPVFVCSKCGCIDNTVTADYWWQGYDTGSKPEKPLCAQCNPEIGKWHGEFERRPLRPDEVVGPDDFVYDKGDPYLERLLKEEQEKKQEGKS